MAQHIAQHLYRNDAGSPDGQMTAASYLELVSSALMDAHNSEDPLSHEFLRAHCSKDFRMINASVHECPLPLARSIDEHIENIAALKRANPAWTVGAYNFTALFEESENYAIVHFTSGGSGGPGTAWDTNRESVSQLYWRRRKKDGAWEAYKQ